MKKLLILAFVFIANTSNAQWESKNSVDEFGLSVQVALHRLSVPVTL